MAIVVSSRQIFGEWGLELDSESFAAAVAELGVARSLPGSPEEHECLDRVLSQHQVDRKQLQRSPLTLEWNGLDNWASGQDPRFQREAAGSWAAAWRALARELILANRNPQVQSDARIRLEVSPHAWGVDSPGDMLVRVDPQWLVKTLLGAPLVSSVTFLSGEPEHSRPWDWPIDIAFLDDAASRRLRGDLEGQYWKNFVRFSQADQATSQIDILLLPFNVPDAIASLFRSRHPSEVHTVLALGGSPRVQNPLILLDALRREAGALAAGTCRVAPEGRHGWLDSVLFSLSHNRTLDEALFAASGYSAAGAELLLLGSVGALVNARASVAAVRVCQRAKLRLSAKPDLDGVAKMASENVRKHLGIESKASPRILATRLGRSPEDLPWHHEGEAASAVASVAKAASEGPDSERDNRLVQGRVFALSDGVDAEILKAALQASTPHRLDIRIAAPNSEWAQAPVSFPTDRLPPDAEGHELTVVMVDAGLLPEPLVGTLWLPALGNSKILPFYFSTGGQAKRLDARVTILYQNRILQTLKFRAAIAGRAETAEETQGLQIELPTIVRQNLHGLSGSPKFDAALLLNDDATGAPGLTAFQDKKAAYVSLQSLEGLRRRVRAELEKITAKPQNYGDPDNKATCELLVTLARLGRGFYDAFAELPGIGALLAEASDGSERRPRRLQLLSKNSGDLLSLELCYDQEMPDEDAEVCPEWPKVLNKRPPTERRCQYPCQRDLLKTVCPLGFWGMFDTIERHMYEPEKAADIQGHGAEFEVRCEAVDERRALPPLRSVLLGAADKAKEFDPVEFQVALDGMKAFIEEHGGRLIEVGSWKAWDAAIGTPDSPDLLMLMAHNEEIMGASMLQIGPKSDKGRTYTKIKAPQVHMPPVVPPEAGPLVLLFGCRTATDEVPFQSFISAFRKAGASVVVATLSTVRGRHMAPAAKETLAVLLEHANSEPESIGDVLVDVRRRLLAKGMPVGFTFVAFGDASWQLGRMT